MENWENQNFEQDSYQTGSTKPPKNRGGLVAGLLVAVILLAGVSSILGLMNIQLFRMLQEEKGSSAFFSPNETKAVTPGQIDASGKPKLGLSVGSISELDQRYYHLPAGVLITEVDHQGCAATAGLAVGDIILTFNGVSILTPQALEQVLLACQAGDRAEVEFYRYRTQEMRKVTVTLETKG